MSIGARKATNNICFLESVAGFGEEVRVYTQGGRASVGDLLLKGAGCSEMVAGENADKTATSEIDALLPSHRHGWRKS